MNTPKDHFSDEILNAYIDGELSREDCARIDDAMRHDELLRRRVADLNRVSDLVRMAFSEEAHPEPSPSPAPVRFQKATQTAWRAAATVAFVGLGSLLGWHMLQHRAPDRLTNTDLTTANVSDSGQTGELPTRLVSVSADSVKVMFHIGRNDMTLFHNVLTEVEHLLRAADDDKPLVVRIIASHGGLSLFGADRPDNAERVGRVSKHYTGRVAFIGCGETYDQWRKTKSGKNLVPQMVMVDSGVRELLRSQQRGWTFVSI